MTNPTTFYNKADLWEVSPDPGSGEVSAADRSTTSRRRPRTNVPQAASSTGRRIDPIYLLIEAAG